MQRTELNSQDKFDIWGVSLDPSSGVLAGSPAKINQYSSGEQLHPQIVSQGGEVVYVWESVGQDLGGHGIVGRSYPNGEEFVINSQRNLDQYDPAIAADNQGRVVVAWANTIDAANSIISAQHFQIGGGAAVQVADSGSGLNMESVPSSPAAPSLVPPAEPAAAPVVIAAGNSGGTTVPDVPTVAAPTFPQPPTVSAAARAVAAQANIRSGTTTPGRSAAAPNQPAAASFGINRFPTRSSLRSGLTTPGQAASSALQQMARVRQNLGGSASAGLGQRLRSGVRGGSPSYGGASLSRATLMNPALRSVAQNGIRSGVTTRPPAFAARNSGGIGAARNNMRIGGVQSLVGGLANRSGTSGMMTRSGTAQNRFDMLRQQAQAAGSAANAMGSRQVPAGLQTSGNNMAITWQGRAGARYQVQGSNDRASWQNHGGVKSGTGASSATVDRNYRYYRVIESK